MPLSHAEMSALLLAKFKSMSSITDDGEPYVPEGTAGSMEIPMSDGIPIQPRLWRAAPRYGKLLGMSRRAWLIVGLICGALAVGILGGILLSKSRTDVAGEWGKSLLTLFVAILISGLLALILSDYSHRQQQRDADREQASNWLRSLVEANNRVNAAVLLLNAREGAALQGEQVRNLIEARVMLRSLQEDLEVSLPLVAAELGEMIKYLANLGDEYRENYYRLAWAQSVHEEFMKRQMTQHDLPREPIEDPADPWMVLHRYFPKVVDLLGHGENYKQAYSAPYHRARERLRNKLKKLSAKELKARDLS